MFDSCASGLSCSRHLFFCFLIRPFRITLLLFGIIWVTKWHNAMEKEDDLFSSEDIAWQERPTGWAACGMQQKHEEMRKAFEVTRKFVGTTSEDQYLCTTSVSFYPFSFSLFIICLTWGNEHQHISERSLQLKDSCFYSFVKLTICNCLTVSLPMYIECSVLRAEELQSIA